MASCVFLTPPRTLRDDGHDAAADRHPVSELGVARRTRNNGYRFGTADRVVDAENPLRLHEQFQQIYTALARSALQQTADRFFLPIGIVDAVDRVTSHYWPSRCRSRLCRP